MLDLTGDKLIELDRRVSFWIDELAKKTRKKRANHDLQVCCKDGDKRNLVTDIDRENQKALISKILTLDSDARFVCEEAGEARADSMDGQVWFVDPIDGTLNFVQENRDYAIMLALYQDGRPVLGWIFDVPRNRLFHGGPAIGTYQDDEKLPAVKDEPLSNSVVIVSGRRLVNGEKPYGILAKEALAYRVLGSAGISFTRLLVGSASAYLSKLSPWDLAAGRALAEGLGYEVKNLDCSSPNMLLSNTVLIATTKIHRELVKMLKD
ncbi:inositol monophosphatase family protein [Fructobacillus sp. W13]|uniref:Inositol monophosphatase family protein n=1 Tax=Fructobacillus apis TaxID=2935017 RepID=A0ABT0ZRC7_9LACO|nr:inositol monophosphatase family protein [Fructobacillus apis]